MLDHDRIVRAIQQVVSEELPHQEKLSFPDQTREIDQEDAVIDAAAIEAMHRQKINVLKVRERAIITPLAAERLRDYRIRLVKI